MQEKVSTHKTQNGFFSAGLALISSGLVKDARYQSRGSGEFGPRCTAWRLNCFS